MPSLWPIIYSDEMCLPEDTLCICNTIFRLYHFEPGEKFCENLIELCTLPKFQNACVRHRNGRSIQNSVKLITCALGLITTGFRSICVFTKAKDFIDCSIKTPLQVALLVGEGYRHFNPNAPQWGG